MFELLEAFRLHAAGRPLLLFLGLAAGGWIAIRRRASGDGIRPAPFGRLAIVLGAVVLLAYAASAVRYARDEH
jgi:hypothetical protein